MTGLPRDNDTTAPQDAFNLIVVKGVEGLTNSLRRGHPFSEKALNDMVKLDRRLDAFSTALHDRMGVVENGS